MESQVIDNAMIDDLKVVPAIASTMTPGIIMAMQEELKRYKAKSVGVAIDADRPTISYCSSLYCHADTTLLCSCRAGILYTCIANAHGHTRKCA